MTFRKSLASILCSLVLASSANQAIADKEIEVIPTGKSLAVSSYSKWQGDARGGGKSFPVYTFSIVYERGTNVQVSSLSYAVTQLYRTVGSSIFKSTLADDESTRREIMRVNNLFSQTDALLEAAIRNEHLINLKISNDLSTIKEIRVYNNTLKLEK